MRPALLIATVGSALVLTACSSGAAKSGPTVTRTVTRTVTAAASPSADPEPSGFGAQSLPDPCKLLPLADATTLAGTKLDAPTEAGAAGSRTLCQYVGPTSGPTAQVEVFVGDGVEKQLSIDRDTLHHKFTTVSGIGDQCYQEDGFVFVHKNGLWSSINLVLLRDSLAVQRTRMIAAARTLAANMP